MNLSCLFLSVFELYKMDGHLTTCADPESIVRWGSDNVFFPVDGGGERIQIPFKRRFTGGPMVAEMARH